MSKRCWPAMCTLLAMLVMPVPGSAQTVSEETKAAASELVIAMKAGDQLDKMMPIVIEALKPAIVQGRPEIEKDYPQIARLVLSAFRSQKNVLVEALTLVYARHFSPAELREVTAFVRSPVGQKYVEQMPLISQESMQVGQRIGEKVAAEMQERIIDELRKRGHKI